MSRGAWVLIFGIAAAVASYGISLHFQHPFDPDTLDGQLSWMKTELGLTDAQFARIRELHEASGPRLSILAGQLAQMQAEFSAFERTRRATDRVDFVEFARFVEVRRKVDRECLDSAHQLIRAAAGEMTPRQRQRYLDIVSTIAPKTGAGTD